MPQILQKVLSSRYFMKIKIQLSNVFEPIVLSLNAYGPLIVAKLPTPTITDQPIATSLTTFGCCMSENLPKYSTFFLQNNPNLIKCHSF